LHPRDPRRLESGQFDVAVIGGGIYGLALAYEAASRGLTTALIDAADFGGGVSFNHQKTAHGGLRALQTGRLDRARESIRERRALARMAPRLLRPLPFVVGTYPSLMRNRMALRAAFLVDGIVGRDRNAGVVPELRLPKARLLSRRSTLELFPGIDTDGLTGGALWYDYQMHENDRLTLAVAAGADRAGAVLANYVAATGVIRDQQRVVGVIATDRLSGGRIEVRASLTINAAGAQAGEVMGLLGVTRPYPLIRVMSLMTSKAAGEHALAATTKSGKMLTLVPWRGCALVGTSHSSQLVASSADDVAPSEIQRLIAEANEAFPALRLTRADVTLVHRGLVPARMVATHPDLKPSHEILDHSSDGAPGALTVVSVKYTTARGVAERVIDRAASLLGRRIRPSISAAAVLPGADVADHEALVVEAARRHGMVRIPQPVIRRLAMLYGDHSPVPVAIMASQPALGQPLDAAGTITGAEIIHAIKNEMAVRLTDIVMRRLSLSMARPADVVVRGCAQVAAAELGWTDAELNEEIAELDRAYQVP
jgi:glycerol-3-phosphate dehydrogenase